MLRTPHLSETSLPEHVLEVVVVLVVLQFFHRLYLRELQMERIDCLLRVRLLDLIAFGVLPDEARAAAETASSVATDCIAGFPNAAFAQH